MAEDEVVESRRFERRQERLQRLAANVPGRVRVIPRDDEIRKLLKHPAAGAFRSQGSTEWPLDQFTKRRLADGTITIEVIEPEPEPQLQRSVEQQQRAEPILSAAAKVEPKT